MKTIAALSLGLLVAMATPSRAQAHRSDTSTFSSNLAPPFAAIHVDLPGDVVLHAWDRAQAQVRVTNEVSGRVVGYSNGGSRAAYEVDFTPTDRGIVIAPRPRASLVVVGYSTIREHLRHDVYLPATARICVEDNRNDLTIDGPFAALDVARSGPHALRVRDARSSGAPVPECSATAGGRR